MHVVWDVGILKLAIQTDSIAAIKILQDESRLDHQHANLTRMFPDMIGWNWEVTLSHVYRVIFLPNPSLLKLIVYRLVLIQLRLKILK
ncbi:hypothetical protein LINPERPRIM_LOCUS38349 [Linum perenne]